MLTCATPIASSLKPSAPMASRVSSECGPGVVGERGRSDRERKRDCEDQDGAGARHSGPPYVRDGTGATQFVGCADAIRVAAHRNPAARGRARRALARVPSRWPGPPRRPGSTRSGSATTCSTATTGGPSAGRGRRGRCSPRSPRSPSGSSSARSWRAPAFHPPGLIAKMAATVAEVSGGRFVLGLGAGWNEPEFRAFGLPFDHRVSRFEEAFTIIRGLLAGERVTLDGRFCQAEDAVLLPPPDAPPRLDDRQQRAAHAGRDAAARGRLEHLVRLTTATRPRASPQLNERITGAARARRPRARATIERSACVLVAAGRRGRRAAVARGRAAGRRLARSDRRGACASSHEAGADEVDPGRRPDHRAVDPRARRRDRAAASLT